MHVKDFLKENPKKNNEVLNHSDSAIESKNKTNMFQLFKTNKDKHDNVNLESKNKFQSNSIINAIKSINKKSFEKINSSNIQNKELDKDIEIKNKNVNIFKNLFLKKKSHDQPCYSSTDFSLHKFKTVNLPTLTRRVDWKKRNDAKFVGHVSDLNLVLETLSAEYFMLEHEGNRVMRYMTEYLDTSNRTMFYDHESKNEPRYKIRKRRYENENNFWLEVKKKIKGETYKYRTSNPRPDEINAFIQTNTPYSQCDLNTMLFVYYERMTFIHKTLPLKITIDKNMKVGKGKIWTPFDNLVIIELKSKKSTPACTLNMIKSKGFNPCRISKYYIGMVTLYPELKKTTSRYKPTLLEIKKINKI
jgi:hypothetical protein